MTVEAALGIGAVVAVFLLAVSAMSALLGQLRCIDASVEAARLAARGDRDGARAAVARLAPAGTTLTISTGPELATAEVTAPPGTGLLPEGWRRSRASAVVEPGVEASGSVEPVRPEAVP
ncbi:hypothetical protein GCM10027271_07610 [Saccharopolyspora gloriosae]|uniref:Pilus assembly protein TadE n=1 Tax=Saccharopolyspora gloriosae TaxID=455344 RepID=A0A840NSQ9_9PSEU|nr:hypothetical protein [Saccharopolyspora gloriosae]